MTWSKSQQILIHQAAKAAGWNAEQRYVAMLHAGCPKHPKHGRPSANHPGNSNDAFERVMELAEAMAEPGTVTPPRAHPSWSHAARRSLDRRRDLARQIAAEAVTRIPEVFDNPLPLGERVAAQQPGEGSPDLTISRPHDLAPAERLLRGVIRHVTNHDSDVLCPFKPENLDQCDSGQLYRVIEALKAWVGRELLKRGYTPESFDVPASVRRRLAS